MLVFELGVEACSLLARGENVWFRLKSVMALGQKLVSGVLVLLYVL